MKARGFTLIEILVALAVFSVIAVMSYQGLAGMARNQEGIERAAERQRAIELAMLRLERDLTQALARPARGPYGENLPAMVGGEQGAEWTTLDLVAAQGGVGPQTLRVSYALVGSDWRRRADQVVDRSPRDTARARVALADVERVSWRYIDSGVTRVDQWPPRLGSLPPERLPRAVEVRLVLADVGEIVRLIELPETAL